MIQHIIEACGQPCHTGRVFPCRTYTWRRGKAVLHVEDDMLSRTKEVSLCLPGQQREILIMGTVPCGFLDDYIRRFLEGELSGISG